jgi:hypothetical protein
MQMSLGLAGAKVLGEQKVEITFVKNIKERTNCTK